MSGVDFDAILADARLNLLCAECGAERDYRERPRSLFCSPRCRYRFRDRRRYAKNPAAQRERARAYYWANREKVLERAAARRGASWPPPQELECSECGEPLEGRSRVVCSRRRCKDARWRRLNPEAYQEKERRKAVRRQARRAEGGS